MSTTRKVSIIGSITSSGIRVNLLFWMFNVSKEFKFSNDDAGNTEMLTKRNAHSICDCSVLFFREFVSHEM